MKSRRECQREAGELLKQMEKQKPGEYKRGHHVHVTPSLKDLGIHHKQSQRWQQIAELPEVIFEEVIEETKEEKALPRISSALGGKSGGIQCRIQGRFFHSNCQQTSKISREVGGKQILMFS